MHALIETSLAAWLLETATRKPENYRGIALMPAC